MAFNLEKFFVDIFDPQPGETVTIMHDLPHGEIADRDAWRERRQMAADWHAQLAELGKRMGFSVAPLTAYEATGKHNADLPMRCVQSGREVSLKEVVTTSTIILAMPEFSATAPLKGFAVASGKLRVGSMPGVARFMEESGLSADYAQIARRCEAIAPLMEKAIGANVTFSTGHGCHFDLRFNHAHKDDGNLHPRAAGTTSCLSNLPAGEVFQVPYEGDRGEPSKTAGELPEKRGEELIVYEVEENTIVDVKGNGQHAAKMRAAFADDPAWRNIAEFAFGVNDKARVTGIILEDEKAGFHWAFGRSDHLGGTVGVSKFKSPTNVIHQDIVYAVGNPIVAKKIDLIFEDGTKKTMLIDGKLTV